MWNNDYYCPIKKRTSNLIDVRFKFRYKQYYLLLSKNLSASKAAIQPAPAEVIA